MTTAFSELPAEIISAIGRILSIQDLMRFRWISRTSRAVVRGDRALFRRILLHKFHRKLTTRDVLKYIPHAAAIPGSGFICVRHSFLEAVLVLSPRDARVTLKVHVGPSMTLKRDLILRKGEVLRTNLYDAVQFRRCQFCVVWISFDVLSSGLSPSEIKVTTVSLAAPAELLVPPREISTGTGKDTFLLPRAIYVFGGCLIHYVYHEGDAQIMFCPGQCDRPPKCSCRI